nr:heptaprenyl diphosphate synthase component 1 [Mesobacillus harenae]
MLVLHLYRKTIEYIYFWETRVIPVQEIQVKLTEIKKLIVNKAAQPYLLKYIAEPKIDEDKLLLLISFMKQQEMSDENIERYALATMLIQIALDTHEMVENSYSHTEESSTHKNRQLTVLAGTYYSGLYYQLLSHSSEIPLIKSLADGVKEVNEQKIVVYQNEMDKIETLMESIKVIESALFEKLSNHFYLPGWVEFSSNLLLVKRLKAEKKLFMELEYSLVFDCLQRLTFPEKKLSILSHDQQVQLITICDSYIDKAQTLINEALAKLPGLNSLLKERVQSIIKQQPTLAKISVEEG